MDIRNLWNVSQPKVFTRGEYICSEGEEGEDMYIILQGKVEVYINSVMQDSIKVAEVGCGEFFGEMAIFEKMPRSATCVAAEDTTCIAINKSNLENLIKTCPEIIEKLLYSLSQRIREMNDRIYKKGSEDQEVGILPFSIPGKHLCNTGRDNSDRSYLRQIRVSCPLCSSSIVVMDINFQKMQVKEFRYDQRKVYDKFNVLWHYMRSCPECGYTNFYANFGNIMGMSSIDRAKEAVAEENRYFEDREKLVNKFDLVTAGYYKAIHFNECVNEEDTFLLGRLWLNLFWVYEDAENEEMKKYCADKALCFFKTTYMEKRKLLKREVDKQQCAMILAELYYFNKDLSGAKQYYHEAMNYSNKNVCDQAYKRICELRKAEKNE